MKSYISHSLDETREIAKDWLGELINRPFGGSSAVVVGLSGHLGAGKTAFVKIVGKLLGVKEEITSPTFVIMKIYEFDNQLPMPDLSAQAGGRQAITHPSIQRSYEGQGNNQFPINSFQLPWTRLVHIDAYRLERAEEVNALNFEQLVADPHNLIMIEWPENVELHKLVGEHEQIDFEIKEGVFQVKLAMELYHTTL